MPKELVFFHKGLKYGERSVLQEPGALQTAENITFVTDGKQELRPAFGDFNSGDTSLNAIHSIKRFDDYLVVADGGNLRWRSSTAGDFTSPQDFTSYTEVDVIANALQDIAATSFSISSVDVNETVYLYKDFVAGYFSSNFTHQFKINISEVNTVLAGFVWGMSNSVGILNVNPVGAPDFFGVYVEWNAASLGIGVIKSESGVSSSDSLTGLSLDTDYYITVTRNESEGGFGKLYCYIFSDEERTTQVAGSPLSVTLTVRTNYRYLYAMSSYYAVGGGYALSGTVSNLALEAATSAGVSNSIMYFREYKDLLHMVNGTDRLFLDTSGNLYNAYVANPTTAPTLTAAAGAGKTGVYKGYVSYLITFAGGQTYETGLSTGSSDVTTSGANLQINWTSIPLCPYEPVYAASAVTIHRKLYIGPGTGGTLTDIFYAATISNNTTTTYTDNITEATLAANGACTVDEYTTPPTDPKYLEYHYGRLFLIPSTSSHRLWYSETPAGATASANENIIPLAFTSTNWDDLRTAGYGGKVDPQGLISWGEYLYIPLKHTWIRKNGNGDPSSWNYKKCWADIGISAPHSIAICSKLFGILGITTPKGGVPGVSLFNGQTAVIITGPEFNYIFETDLNIDYIDKCRGAWDGRYYYMLYPNGSETDVNKLAAFDLSRYPDIRIAMWEDLSPRSIDVYNQDNEIYIGGSDGTVRYNAGTEAINVDIKSKDLIGGDRQLATTPKRITQLKYALNSGGSDVTLEIDIDGTTKTWSDATTTYTISGSGDTIQVLNNFPQDFVGYKFTIRIYATGLSTFELYSPWEVHYDVVQ